MIHLKTICEDDYTNNDMDFAMVQTQGNDNSIGSASEYLDQVLLGQKKDDGDSDTEIVKPLDDDEELKVDIDLDTDKAKIMTGKETEPVLPKQPASDDKDDDGTAVPDLNIDDAQKKDEEVKDPIVKVAEEKEKTKLAESDKKTTGVADAKDDKNDDEYH